VVLGTLRGGPAGYRFQEPTSRQPRLLASSAHLCSWNLRRRPSRRRRILPWSTHVRSYGEVVRDGRCGHGRKQGARTTSVVRSDRLARAPWDRSSNWWAQGAVAAAPGKVGRLAAHYERPAQRQATKRDLGRCSRPVGELRGKLVELDGVLLDPVAAWQSTFDGGRKAVGSDQLTHHRCEPCTRQPDVPKDALVLRRRHESEPVGEGRGPDPRECAQHGPVDGHRRCFMPPGQADRPDGEEVSPGVLRE
jgi:hypothetical protein